MECLIFVTVIQSWNMKIGFISIFRFPSKRKSKHKNSLDFHILICCFGIINEKQVVFYILASVRKNENQTILSPLISFFVTNLDAKGTKVQSPKLRQICSVNMLSWNWHSSYKKWISDKLHDWVIYMLVIGIFLVSLWLKVFSFH